MPSVVPAPEIERAPARILVVDDDPDMLRLLSMRLGAAGYLVSAVNSAEAALAQLDVERPQLVLSDVQLPGRDGLALFDRIRERHPSLPVILLTAHGTIPDAVEATARGVFTYLTKPFDGKDLLAKIREALALFAEPTAGNSSKGATRPARSDERWRAGIVSRSARMADLLAEARMVAQTDATVLLLGESGTGKELLAQAIHRASPRADKPFVAINCGAIPENLLESELFGHVKGAFTDAIRSHPGLFQTAHGGTVLLDEIGDMPSPLQVKLLRVLQERAVRPVGAAESIAVDVRIISATHRDLDAALAAGQFREDLYYRLNVVQLHLPPLADRREDIALLANHFLAQLAAKYGKRVSGFAPEALKALTTAAWPGNVRQLFNVVEQTCALATTPLVPLALVQRALRSATMPVLSYGEAKQRFEREYLVGLLKLTDGNVSDAARLAERNRTEFYRLLQRNGLTPGHFKAEADGGTVESVGVADKTPDAVAGQRQR
ncbi:MAG: sigma 54-interacting transcriptional regulator [Burkholderiaceae bacterium]